MKKIFTKYVDNEKALLLVLFLQLMVYWVGALWVSYGSQFVAYQKF